MPNDNQITFKFEYQPAQRRSLRWVTRGTGRYLEMESPQHLEVGGVRSGKTCGKLIFGVQEYSLKYRHCDILVLRRTIAELDSGVIQDFHTLVPPELYEFNKANRIATFHNGSRVVFAGCVREGTLIDTERGLVPIELVTTADRVLTRQGYKRVLWSGMTGIKKVVSLGQLDLTPEHPVFCEGEFILAQEVLCRKDSGKTARLLIQKSSFLKAMSTVGGRTPTDTITGTILLAEETNDESRYTLRSGKASTDLFPSVTKFITPTITLSTTTQPTSSFSAAPNTGSYTHMRGVGDSNRANGARKNSSLVATINDSAEKNAVIKADLKRNIEVLSGTVNSAPLQFWEIDVKTLNTVITYADNGGTPVPVYDLTVEDEHEYFANGILVHNCSTGAERDIEKYLGQAYPYILVDECSQFSRDIWERLYSRNVINTACEPDEHGNFPIPCMVGCTNPIGAWWDYYHTVFVKKEPWEKEDGMKRARDGSYWAPRGGEFVKAYDPRSYSFNHTTVLDNKIMLQRDPGIVVRLKSLPLAKRRKFLEGYMGTVDGQYFDCWAPEYHIVDLREDPEAIIWQPWQPVIGGQDWGVGHHNAFYLFTKALVRHGACDANGNKNTDYRMKTVCIREVAPEQTGLTSIEFADLIKASARYPTLPQDHPQFAEISNKPCKIAAIFFSHEKFSRVLEAHSPADEYSRVLRERGLPPVSRGTTDRIASAGYMYNELKLGKLVILASCPAIIQAIPMLQRDPDRLDDVLKTNAKSDDRYDAFRLGLFGMYKEKGQPGEVADRLAASKITDPMAKFLFGYKQKFEREKMRDEFRQPEVAAWSIPFLEEQ